MISIIQYLLLHTFLIHYQRSWSLSLYSRICIQTFDLGEMGIVNVNMYKSCNILPLQIPLQTALAFNLVRAGQRAICYRPFGSQIIQDRIFDRQVYYVYVISNNVYAPTLYVVQNQIQFLWILFYLLSDYTLLVNIFSELNSDLKQCLK